MHLLALVALLLPPPAAPLGLRVPPGFEVTEFANSTLANDIYCLTLDPRGRLVVSGRGYVRLLLDRDGDGRADTGLDFAGAPADGAMGLFWEGETLWCVGGGGLHRYRDAGGAGRQRPPERVLPLKTGGEHDAHAVGRGPDGWLYVLCGNGSGLSRRHTVLPTSPLRAPVAGCLLRLPPDLHGCEVVADGFRNPYGMDWNADGELFTYDSDNERCVALPWYEGTRCYHVFPGGHHGWQSPQRAQTWRLPPHFLDVVAPVADLGRGSPTGVVCYRHAQFPPKYRGGLFLLDWTFGRIHFVKPTRAGSSYTATPEVFLQAIGDNGFAPTAAAVHPITGDLYVAVGGRGTRGAVYRIRYRAGLGAAAADEVARLRPAPRSLAWEPGTQEEWLRRASRGAPLNRLRALHHIQRHRTHFTAIQVGKAVRACWGEPDRYLRQAAACLLATLPETERHALARTARTPHEQITAGLAGGGAVLVPVLADSRLDATTRLEAVRLLQKALAGPTARHVMGTVWEGYARAQDGPSCPADALAAVRAAFPSGNVRLDRELTRTLALVEDDDPATLHKVAAMLTPRSHPVENLHTLIVLARLRGPRPPVVTQTVARALLGLDARLDALHLNRDRNWPLRVAELHAELARKDSALNAALLAHPDFGRPDHVLLSRCPGFDRRRAAAAFLARAGRTPAYAWNAELVHLLDALPAERSFAVLRSLWGEHGLDEAILPLLARRPAEEDRARFVWGLDAVQAATVRQALDALAKLPARPPDVRRDADEVIALARALRRLPMGKEEDRLRQRLEERLRRLTGQNVRGTEAWLGWCTRTYPEQAARLANPDGVDGTAWEKRLTGLDWTTGDAGRGREVFVRASCAACHSGGQALGPDLRGVTGRFARADLFTAILRPSKDVSPRYRTTLIATTDGKVYQGLIVYEAADSVLLQTGPAATVRLAQPQISARRPTDTSLMPAGLLDRLPDRDLADLYAYLRSLGAAATKQ